MNKKFIFLSHPVKVAICGDHKEVTKEMLKKAFFEISNFVEEHQLSVEIKATVIKKVIVYDYQHKFIEAVVNALKLEDASVLPKTLSGAVVSQTLHVLSRDKYERVFYEEGKFKDGYEKIFIHEIAHLLHIDLLKGQEDLMGPRWFYEGFATYVAKQFLDQSYESEFLLDIIEKNKDTRYTFYADIFRRIVKHKTLNELIYHINDENYIENLKKYI